MTVEPKFQVGDIVRHQRFDYRGVIYDVDPDFRGTDAWYSQVATSKPPKDRPWYHVMVDGSVQTTYVAERHLQLHSDDSPVNHPFITQHFDHHKDGRYGRVLH